MNYSDKPTLADRDRALFNAIAESYQRKDLCASSRVARRHRLLQTLSRFKGEMHTHALLEVGCGAGFSVDYLSYNYEEYLGIDPSAQLITYARTHFPRAAFFCGDVTQLVTDRLFDGVFMIGVLHHMESPIKQLKALRSHMLPSAWIAMNEPNAANPLIQLMRWMRKFCDRDYSEEQRTFTHRSLEQALDAAGFEQISTSAQGFFSTPLAEVALRSDHLWAPVAQLATVIDQYLEKKVPRLFRWVSWNIVATARKSSK